MIKRVLKCGYDLSDASNEEIEFLLKDTNCKHIWANKETLQHFREPMWGGGSSFTRVNAISNNVIFINHYY